MESFEQAQAWAREEAPENHTRFVSDDSDEVVDKANGMWYRDQASADKGYGEKSEGQKEGDVSQNNDSDDNEEAENEAKKKEKEDQRMEKIE